MLRIGATPAQVARKGLSYLIGCGGGVSVQKCFCCYHKPWRSVAALHAMVFDVGIDERVVRRRKTLHGLYMASVSDKAIRTRFFEGEYRSNGLGCQGKCDHRIRVLWLGSESLRWGSGSNEVIEVESVLGGLMMS